MFEFPRNSASKQDCQTAVRALELEAYSLILTAFRARGLLNDERLTVLDQLRDIFKLSLNRHNAEFRRICNDPELANLAVTVNGVDEWIGSELSIGFPHSANSQSDYFISATQETYQTAYRQLADDLQRLTSRHNKKLTLKKQKLEKDLNRNKRQTELEKTGGGIKYHRFDPQLPTCSKFSDKVNKIVDSVASLGPPVAPNSSHVTYPTPCQQTSSGLTSAASLGGPILSPSALQNSPAAATTTATATVLVACGQRYFVMPSSFFVQNSAVSPPASAPITSASPHALFNPLSASSRDKQQPQTPQMQPTLQFRAPSLPNLEKP